MAKPIHVMVRVKDLDASIHFYDAAFAMKVADRFDFDSFTLVYLRNPENDFEIELTWNHGRAEPYVVMWPSPSTISTTSMPASPTVDCSRCRSRSSTATVA